MPPVRLALGSQRACMKRIRIILSFLLLGLVVNVAVAWGCASFVHLYEHPLLRKSSGPGLTSEAGACWRLRKTEYFGYTLLVGRAILEGDRMNSHFMDYNPENVPHVPAWSQFAVPPSMRMWMGEISSGWPFHTLSWFSTVTPSTTTYIHRHVWSFGEYPDENYLPLAPIWSGLLLNTLFYAAILWLLIPGPFVLRRLIRIKRGLCETCAYDLRGAEHDACPECGRKLLGTCSTQAGEVNQHTGESR